MPPAEGRASRFPRLKSVLRKPSPIPRLLSPRLQSRRGHTIRLAQIESKGIRGGLRRSLADWLLCGPESAGTTTPRTRQRLSFRRAIHGDAPHRSLEISRIGGGAASIWYGTNQ